MPGVHILANKPSGGLAQRKHVRSTTQPAWTETLTWEWVGQLGQTCRPRCTISNVPTSMQKHESASKHGSLQRGRAVSQPPLSDGFSISLPTRDGRGEAKWTMWGGALAQLMLISKNWGCICRLHLILSGGCAFFFHQGDQSSYFCLLPYTVHK